MSERRCEAVSDDDLNWLHRLYLQASETYAKDHPRCSVEAARLVGLRAVVDADRAGRNGGIVHVGGVRRDEADRLPAIEFAARAFLSALGETADDVPGRARVELLALRVALAAK